MLQLRQIKIFCYTALTMAMELANKVNADIVIGTDPDADRLGIAVRNNTNELVLLNGKYCLYLQNL